MILAAAQTTPHIQNIEKNIEDHVRLIDMAVTHNAQLIVFPEMSLTGYERELADEQSLTEDDSRLEVLKEKAAMHRMIIVAGAPIKIKSKLYIGAFIFFPDRTTSIYTKQFLHDGEEKFFSPGYDHNPVIGLGREKISIAICADIANPLHPENAAKNDTTIYVAGIFYTPNGIAEGYDQLGSYAKKYKMNALMANYGGPSYQLESAGQSAFWDNTGELIAKLNGDEGLLVVSRTGGNWQQIKV